MFILESYKLCKRVPKTTKYETVEKMLKKIKKFLKKLKKSVDKCLLL